MRNISPPGIDIRHAGTHRFGWIFFLYYQLYPPICQRDITPLGRKRNGPVRITSPGCPDGYNQFGNGFGKSWGGYGNHFPFDDSKITKSGRVSLQHLTGSSSFRTIVKSQFSQSRCPLMLSSKFLLWAAINIFGLLIPTLLSISNDDISITTSPNAANRIEPCHPRRK